MALPATAPSAPDIVDIVPPLLLPPIEVLEPSPFTVKLPVAALPPELSHTIPFDPLLAEIDLKVNDPSDLIKLTAVELPVDMLSPFTVSPVTLLALSVPP